MSVYFIQCGEDGPIKIGFTRGAPEARMADLQTAHHEELRLLLTIFGSHLREGELHERFHEHHIRGEWFRPHPEILGFIDGAKMALMISGALHHRPEDEAVRSALDAADALKAMLSTSVEIELSRFGARAWGKTPEPRRADQTVESRDLANRGLFAVHAALHLLSPQDLDFFERELAVYIARERDRRARIAARLEEESAAADGGIDAEGQS